MQRILVAVFIVIFIWILLKSLIGDARNERKETRICRYCGMEIPYRASRCPYCLRDPGTDLRAEGRLFKKSFGFKLIIFYLAIMIVLGALAYLMFS